MCIQAWVLEAMKSDTWRRQAKAFFVFKKSIYAGREENKLLPDLPPVFNYPYCHFSILGEVFLQK